MHPLSSPFMAALDLDFNRIWPSLPFILQGLVVTIQFTVLSALLGFAWGTILSLCKISSIKPLYWFGTIYTSIFRGTPLLVTLSLIYFATPQLTGQDITGFQAGVITFALNSGAYVSEVIRAGILAVNKGQTEAAVSLGVRYRPMMLDIILPQAVKNILPALVNESIALLKDSTLVSVIGAQDLLRRAQIVAAEKYVYFEPLLIVAVVYYVIVMLLSLSATVLERRMQKSS